MKPYRNDVGQTAVEMPSGRHPRSHFETESARIEPATNGGFTVHHHLKLKKKYAAMRHMEGSYMEPEQHVFSDAESMHEHLKTIFKGGPKAVAAEKAEGEGEGKSENA